MKMVSSDFRAFRGSARTAFYSACLVVFALILLARPCQAQAVNPEAEADHPTAPVVLDGSVLLRLRGVSALPAEQRVQAIAERIEGAAQDPTVAADAIQVTETESGSAIIAGERQLMIVTAADAALEGIDRQTLAQVLRTRIGAAIQRYRLERTAGALLRDTSYALGAILALALIVFLVIRTFRKLQAGAERLFQSKIQASLNRSLKLLPSERLLLSLKAALRALRNLTILVLIFLCTNYVLGLYPWTRSLAQQLFGIFVDPLRTMGLGVLRSVPNIAFVVMLAVIIRYAIMLMRFFFEAIAQRTISFSNFEHDWAMPTFRILRLMVIAFAVVIAYPYLPGSQSDAFKGVSLFIGVILSLGSSSAIANVIAGYSLTYRRAFKVGDRVKIGDAYGDVAEIRVQVTHVRSVKNEEIIIPNSEILNSQVINYSSIARQHGLILHTTVGIGYETPWRQVEGMLLQAAARTEGLQPEPLPFVLQKALGDFAVTYELNVYCDQPKRAGRLYSALHRSILDVFNEYGVQIMTPAYEGDPEVPKVVPKEKWFESPAAHPTASIPSAGGQATHLRP